MDKHFLRWYISELIQKEKDIVINKDEDVICLDVKGSIVYLYIKSLTYAGNPYPTNTTRAQLPRRDEFEKIRTSKCIFLFLGYDEKNEVFACWDPELVKSRLNYREYVSFFSRLSQQESVKRGVIKSATLTNGLKYVLFNINDLTFFLLHIKDYFLNLDLLEINNIHKQMIHEIKNDIKVKQDVLHKISDDSRVKSFLDKLLLEEDDSSMLTIVSNCMNEFCGFYHKMTLKDWYRIINNYIKSIKKNTLMNKSDVIDKDETKSTNTKYQEKRTECIDNEADPNYDDLEIEYVYLDKKGDVVSTSTIPPENKKQNANTLDNRRGKSWTEEEEKQIRLFFEQGISIREIAEKLGRTEVAIKSRLGKLGLIEYIYGQEEETSKDNQDEEVKEETLTPLVNPKSSEIIIDVKKLMSVFDKKITSYKYFWFMAIISLLKERNEPSLLYEKILVRMAAIAWPIVLDYGIELGDKDMMNKYLNEIQRKTYIIKAASSRIVESSLSRYYGTMGIKDILRPLLNNVPYRFLSPWVKFTNNEEVKEKSKLDSFDGLYALYPDRIILKAEWWDYIEQHYDELRDFAFRSFLDYAKQYNNDLKLLKLMSKGKF